MNEFPKSINLGMYEAKDFYVTAASWDTGYGPSYELGIRRKSAGEGFTLIQGGWNERTIGKVLKAVGQLLDCGHGPTDIQDILQHT
jgi:hypothetical protein